MSINDGEPVAAATDNSKLMSKTVDTGTSGRLDLNNLLSASGSIILNIQREMNASESFTGLVPGSAKDVVPSWSSNDIGLITDDLKDRADALTVASFARVVAPGSATDNAIARFDSTTGKLLQNSGVTIDDSNNMIIPGNLTVNGTTTQIDSTNLNVSDQNITINDGGNDASSEGAGLTVERVSTDGSLVYEDALTSKWKLGALGSEIEIADVSSTQTLSAKTLASPIVTTLLSFANQAESRYAEQVGNGSNYVGFSAPDDITTGNTIWKLPDGDGSANQVIGTDGAGNLSFQTVGVGGTSLDVTTETANFTVLNANDVLHGDATAGDFTFALPTAASAESKIFYFTKIDPTLNEVIIAANGSETINGEPTLVLTDQYERRGIISNGTSWNILI